MVKQVILMILWSMLILPNVFALEFRPWDETILTKETSKVVSEDISWSDNAINAGIDAIWWGEIKGIYGEDIADSATAWEKATNLMKWFINYALSLIWLVALWYLVVNWFIMLTAGNDDERAQRWLKWIKTAFIAIAWIALSWFLLSLIFFLIFTVTDGL